MSANLTITSDKGQTLVNLPEEMEVSLSNRNAHDVLTILGFSGLDEEGFSSILSVQEMWAACNRYLTSEMGEFVDRGKETVQVGNVIDCGRQEGYFQIRIDAIQRALEWSMNHGGKFCYFA